MLELEWRSAGLNIVNLSMRKILLKNQPMTPLERRSVAVLAGIYGLRILGLFLILPVFSLYAAHLQGSTPFLIGMALGIYGLTNAILQIPLGTLSDRIGRKPVIAAGLLIFACGSVVAAVSDSITGVIIGRAIQGAGAIAAAAMALTADLTSEELWPMPMLERRNQGNGSRLL